MCGIIGFTQNNRNKIEKSLEKMEHRGPDDFGIFCDQIVSFGHRRLSILDLSQNGHQPFISGDENLVIIFNGEIYNYIELKKDLSEFDFKSTSDTEVILYGYKKFGLDFFSRMRGMWAIAIYNKVKRQVILTRDYFGIKPLYYSIENGNLSFASEMKAMKEILSKLEPNREFYYQYFNLGYFIQPETCYKNVKKLVPGGILVWDLDKKSADLSQAELLEKGDCKYLATFEESVDLIDEVMNDSVKAHFISDVPVGLLLSGGNDSSLIAAIAKKTGYNPVAYNLNIQNSLDSRYARKISQQLGLELVEIEMTAADLERQYEKIWDFVDEPIADSSIIPTSLIYSAIKGKAKVVLSGEGGDELFAGYARHKYFSNANAIVRKNYVVNILNACIGSKSRSSIKNINPIISRVKNFYLDNVAQDQIGLYLNYSQTSSFPIEYEKIRGALFEYSNDFKQADIKRLTGLFFDCWLYLPNDLMYKNDMASMASSIEARVPFLDKQVYETVIRRIDPKFIMSEDYSGKKILKAVMEKYLPKDLIYRPKKGFGFSFERYQMKQFEDDFKQAVAFHNSNKEMFGIEEKNLINVLNSKELGLIARKYPVFAFSLVSNWRVFK